MTLEYKLDSLDGLDEATAGLYQEKDGRWILDVAGHEKNDENKIPKSRLDAEIFKRKSAETQMATIADELKADVPERMQDLIPDLPPVQLITWIRKANANGLFDSRESAPIDNKKPSDRKPADLDGLSPQAMMSQGYKS